MKRNRSSGHLHSACRALLCSPRPVSHTDHGGQFPAPLRASEQLLAWLTAPGSWRRHRLYLASKPPALVLPSLTARSFLLIPLYPPDPQQEGSPASAPGPFPTYTPLGIVALNSVFRRGRLTAVLPLPLVTWETPQTEDTESHAPVFPCGLRLPLLDPLVDSIFSSCLCPDLGTVCSLSPHNQSMRKCCSLL